MAAIAAAKKNAKGNKTAHVLNLLTAPGEAAPAPVDGDAESPVQEAAQSAASRPLLPPILEVAQANDDNLAQQIQQALEDELLQTEEPAFTEEEPSAPLVSQSSTLEESAPAEEPAPAAPPAPQPAAAGGKMSQDDIEKMLASMGAPAEEPAPAAPPAPQPAPDTTNHPAPEEEVSYINIMQTLVEEKAPRYIKMFGLCPCKHCEADVKALTLSNLVPKYVVLAKRDVIPMLTVYEGRFNSTIFAQLTRACKTVMDHPHHDRKS